MRTLLIETSTERGMIAWVEGSQSIVKQLAFGYNQSKYLLPELELLLKECSIPFHSLDCIGIGVGPGSYTGIRVGVAAAKTLAYALKKPLVAVSSLMAFVPTEPDTKFATIFDAKIGGAYLIKGESRGGIISYISLAEVHQLESLESQLEGIPLLVTPSQKTLKGKIDHFYPNNNWRWEEIEPSADAFAKKVKLKWEQGECATDGKVEILYLRKTEAELERERRN